MANGKKGIITIIGICAAIVGMVVGGSTIKGRLTTQAEIRATQAHKVDDTAEAVKAVKAEGCDPARQQKQQIAVGSLEMSYVQSDVEDLKDDVEKLDKKMAAGFREINTKQAANTKTILKAIEDNK